MTKSITILDYGVGNLLSVSRAFEACGAEVSLTDSPENILSADYLVLPGVGAFTDGMRELERRSLVEPIQRFCVTGKPLLGICLGMQLLFTESDEHLLTTGLGIIPGRVESIPNDIDGGGWRKTPHIGWNELLPRRNESVWQNGLLKELGEHPAGYFVHSYSCVPSNYEAVIAECDYDALRLCAAVRQDNVYGCQFHPEKSGALGLHILSNFMAL
jgi:glutamine amidotransferase